MIKKYFSIIMLICIVVILTACSHDTEKKIKNEKKNQTVVDNNKIKNSEKQQIDIICKILCDKNLTINIKEYNEHYKSNENKDFYIETIFETRKDNIDRIINNLNEYCYSPFYYKYNDEMAEGDYGFEGASYLYLRPYFENLSINEYFGEKYDEFCYNQYFKRNIDINKFEKIIYDNKNNTKMGEQIIIDEACKKFAYYYNQINEIILKRLNLEYFEYENFIVLKEWPMDDYINNEYDENGVSLYYWCDEEEQDNYNVFLKYFEKIEEMNDIGICSSERALYIP